MTIKTNRNNIEPMLRFVTLVMVIVRRLFTTRTLQRIWSRQSIFFYRSIDNLTSFNALGITNSICKNSRFTFFAVCIAFLASLAFLALVIAFVRSLAFFALAVLFSTYFTMRLIAIFATLVFRKFRKWFDFFALATSFRYDLLSHNRLLNRRLCLEPVAGHTPAVGSLYYSRPIGGVK